MRVTRYSLTVVTADPAGETTKHEHVRSVTGLPEDDVIHLHLDHEQVDLPAGHRLRLVMVVGHEVVDI